MRFKIVVLSLAVLSALVAVPARAQLNGHNLRGDYGLSSGTQPEPGFWVGLLYPSYDVDTLRNRNGDELPFAGGLRTQAFAPWLWWVSDLEILGGKYSIFVSPSIANAALEAPVLGIDSESGFGLGDLYIQPIVLGWHLARADFLAGLGVFVPVGRYEDGADDNTGLGMWSYEIFGGTTLYLDEAKTWNLAATMFYETHSTKEDSDQEVGDTLTLEGGLGRSLAEGAVNVGIAYFGQWKVTDDDLGLDLQLPDEPPIDPPSLGRHRILGAGPEVTLPLASRKTLYGFLTLRYFWDFGVESNAQGSTFIFNLTLPVPSIPRG